MATGEKFEEERDRSWLSMLRQTVMYSAHREYLENKDRVLAANTLSSMYDGLEIAELLETWDNEKESNTNSK